MVRINFTTHASADREERIIRIATTIGFGEVIGSFPNRNEHGPTMHCITDTGILIVKDRYEQNVITMFALKESRLHYYYGDRVPKSLLQTVRNNQRKRKFLFEI